MPSEVSHLKEWSQTPFGPPGFLGTGHRVSLQCHCCGAGVVLQGDGCDSSSCRNYSLGRKRNGQSSAPAWLCLCCFSPNLKVCKWGCQGIKPVLRSGWERGGSKFGVETKKIAIKPVESPVLEPCWISSSPVLVTGQDALWWPIPTRWIKTKIKKPL